MEKLSDFEMHRLVDKMPTGSEPQEDQVQPVWGTDDEHKDFPEQRMTAMQTL